MQQLIPCGGHWVSHTQVMHGVMGVVCPGSRRRYLLFATSPRLTQPASFTASVKQPRFWQSDPAPWFQHVKTLFHLRGITEDHYRYSQCAAERSNKLLSLPGLGNGSVVDLMDSMLSLLGSDEDRFLFLHIFLCQLPHPVRAALANFPSLAAGGPQSMLVDSQRLVPEDTDQAMVAGVSSRRRKSDLCFFHQRFGHKARCCIPPCTEEPPPSRQCKLVILGHRPPADCR
ncbi:hypothetical protein D4764_02G0003780 [Takifugu flavidus]|uniref:Uncharacterized protein n=1 Tax=Takifugu flavidus TaxID=433684 RepID=A0A5C6NNX1_9TELE|nr:hypothetical protein D4764_02G0003780 [Takifugu flavidus]